MKKITVLFSTFFATLILVACGQTATTPAGESDDVTYKATLTVTFDDGKTETKEVFVEEGDSVMDVLEDAYEIEDEAGMVTAIAGVSQDAAKNTYWMYDVNDKMAEKGAEELLVQEGDTIHFYLLTFE